MSKSRNNNVDEIRALLSSALEGAQPSGGLARRREWRVAGNVVRLELPCAHAANCHCHAAPWPPRVIVALIAASAALATATSLLLLRIF